MGIILEFRRSAEPAPRPMDGDIHCLGQIIIFPGVRIERSVDESAPDGTLTPSGKRAQRSRKKARR